MRTLGACPECGMAYDEQYDNMILNNLLADTKLVLKKGILNPSGEQVMVRKRTYSQTSIDEALRVLSKSKALPNIVNIKQHVAQVKRTIRNRLAVNVSATEPSQNNARYSQTSREPNRTTFYTTWEHSSQHQHFAHTTWNETEA